MLKMAYKKWHADQTLFVKKNGLRITILIVYIDDIVIIGNDMEGEGLKEHLHSEFEIKDLGELRYFLGT